MSSNTDAKNLRRRKRHAEAKRLQDRLDPDNATTRKVSVEMKRRQSNSSKSAKWRAKKARREAAAM